jgi:hypothetical protein
MWTSHAVNCWEMREFVGRKFKAIGGIDLGNANLDVPDKLKELAGKAMMLDAKRR